MDPVTHALAGGLAAKAGLCRGEEFEGLERRGIALASACALAPDLDAVARFFPDPLAYLRYHRGFTHSLIGGGLLALLLAWVFARWFPGVRRRRIVAITAVGVYLHVVLDILTSYGTVLLYPFRDTRFTLDWLYVVDPTFTGILVGGLVAVYFLRRAPRQVAKIGLVSATVYVLLCGALQWHAQQAVAREAVDREIPGIRRIAAVPAPFVPLNWTGVVETDTSYYQARVALGSRARADVDFREVPKVSPVAGRRTLDSVEDEDPEVGEQVRLFRWFARFPVVTVRMDRTARVVEFYDLRFNLPGLGPERRPFVFTVRLDGDGEVVETRLR